MIQQRRRCYDWMITRGNYHYARNRAWSTDYTTLEIQLSTGLYVHGIGTVTLSLLREPGSMMCYDLVLKDVLHCPAAICNGFSPGMAMGVATDELEIGRGVQACDDSGEPIWYGVGFLGLSKLVLAGDIEGESPLNDGNSTPFALSLYATEGDVRMVEDARRAGAI